MGWDVVKSKIVFWSPGAWSTFDWKSLPALVDNVFKTRMISLLKSLYDLSPTAARYLDSLTSGNKTLKIAPLSDGSWAPTSTCRAALIAARRPRPTR